MNKAIQTIKLANPYILLEKSLRNRTSNQEQRALPIKKMKKANSPSAKYGKYNCPNAILSLVEKSSQLKYSAMQTHVVMAT